MVPLCTLKRKQQQAAEKAQRKVDEAHAKGTRKIDKANAKLEQRKSESTEARAKLDSLTGSGESVEQAQSQPEAGIMRAKPEPAPTPGAQATPESSENKKEAPMTAEVTPPPAPAQVSPAPAPEAANPSPMPEQKEEKPRALPKTASPMGLIGLIGLASVSGGYLIRFFRR
jgi:LPXTG-motif cell wall-anchored protein